MESFGDHEPVVGAQAFLDGLPNIGAQRVPGAERSNSSGHSNKFQ
jgi:hypothetical protein